MTGEPDEISTKAIWTFCTRACREPNTAWAFSPSRLPAASVSRGPPMTPSARARALRAHAALEKSLSDRALWQHAVTLNNALDAALGNMTSPLQTALNAALSATRTGLGSTGLAACATEVRAAMEQLVTLRQRRVQRIYLMAGTDNRQSRSRPLEPRRCCDLLRQ